MRLIDADDLKRSFNKLCDRFGEDFHISAIETEIDVAQTVDAVEVVPGQWVGSGDGYADGELVYDMWACSECGYDADGADEKPQWRFCPNCGAKMDGGD